MRNVILASGSPRRQELLEQMGIKFKVVVSDVDESSIIEKEPSELVKALADLKASTVANSMEDVIVIGSDTIVALEDKILGKPKNEEDAKAMLRMLSGNKHTVYTGVTIIDTLNHQKEVFATSTDIYMKDMSDEEIDNYVSTGEPMDKAGSYAIQGKGGIFIQRIEGDYFTVMGLPIEKLYDSLKKFM